jgi:hypothetical protein
LREERNEGAEGDRVARGLQVPAVHIDRVAEGLERVEADAHRQQHVEEREIDLHAEQARCRLLRRLDEEVVVLEGAEQAQVADEAQTEEELARAGRRRSTEPDAHQVVEQRRRQDQPEVAPVPRGVEDARRDEQQEEPHPRAADAEPAWLSVDRDVTLQPRVAHAPEPREREGEEREVIEAVEQHGPGGGRL